TRGDMEKMATQLAVQGIEVRQFQDFTPTPGTISTAMYVTGLDCENRKAIPVAKSIGERRSQRQVLEQRPVSKAPGRQAAERKGSAKPKQKTRRGPS
ncbi:MAG: YgiQ family radical SAM protein, partial [Proteobacteria bacterium]|nr:YgiQ family radical SAM protein [Pseudomonadota bacterium]